MTSRRSRSRSPPSCGRAGARRARHALPAQLDLATGRIVSAEALVRWAHPERGLLLPGAFLPRVEQAGLMRRITTRALDRRSPRAARGATAGLHVPVAVNLSVLNLLDMEIAYEVARLLGRHALSADHLRLEITEDTLMADPERAGAVLAGLDAMGVDLAIDDFGTGHSSLAYLQRLPVEELKIDRCFVGDLDHGANAAIVRATIDLGHALGLRVVAEGVEGPGRSRP
jgi:EAL domain-containing protein (putative c-di-GMP-specific phosphodiesterase class I)